jgi:cyclopropane-fatty-acyl-phospholipid synthase
LTASSPPGRLERLAAPLDPLLTTMAGRLALAAASRIRRGCLTVQLPDGSRRVFGDRASRLQGEMHIHDLEALRHLLLGGEMGGGEAYMEGLWSSPDLVALISLAVANRQDLALSKGWWRVPARVGRTIAHRRNRNTKAGARRNITAHYDLGNDFYRLWLDETMTYSSAVFASPQQSLAEAQRNKYRLMAERAGLQPGQHVLEIGTGWGGFAIRTAETTGADVTTTTISDEQLAEARRRVDRAGLHDQVTLLDLDWRDVSGLFDRIVSIEMIEAVDWRDYDDFFATIERSLRADGLVGIQAICLPDERWERAKNTVDFIRRFVFPNGYLPSVEAIRRSVGRATELRIVDVDDIGLHYAETLRRWRERFELRIDDVRALGLDDRFCRLWRFYLAYCEAGFLERHCTAVQIVLAGADHAEAR